MKKVVVERPRSGSRQRNNKFGARLRYIADHDYEDQPKKARGFESYAGGHKKWFTDVLGPLERFLRSNLGRPWDKVYSELCASLDKRKTTGLHIFQHLKDIVTTNCHVGDDRKVYCYRWGEERPVSGFYVHPRTRLLCEIREESKRERNRRLMPGVDSVSRLYLDDDRGYQKHNDIWYRVKFTRVVVEFRDPVTEVYDIFLKRKARLNWGVNWVAIEKQQCHRDELKEIRRLLESGKARSPKDGPA